MKCFDYICHSPKDTQNFEEITKQHDAVPPKKGCKIKKNCNINLRSERKCILTICIGIPNMDYIWQNRSLV